MIVNLMQGDSMDKRCGVNDTETGNTRRVIDSDSFRFWHKPLFDAQDEIKSLAEPQGLTNTAVALRWLLHHSKLQEGDGIIIGGSSIPHVQQNLEAIKDAAPLGEEILTIIDQCWEDIRGVCPVYFR